MAVFAAKEKKAETPNRAKLIGLIIGTIITGLLGLAALASAFKNRSGGEGDQSVQETVANQQLGEAQAAAAAAEGQSCAARLASLYARYGYHACANSYVHVDAPAKTAAIFARLRNGGCYWARLPPPAVADNGAGAFRGGAGCRLAILEACGAGSAVLEKQCTIHARRNGRLPCAYAWSLAESRKVI